MDILHRAQAIGLSVQVNTTVAKHNVEILEEMIPFLQEVGAVQWSLFFLVPTGRAQASNMISAEEHEQVFHWLYELSKNAPFDIKSTAAPMYRRVAIERKRVEQGSDQPVTFQGAGFQYADGLNRPTRGVNDGNGFLFISHIGDIQPSGFLPLTAGNVRTDDVIEVYRTLNFSPIYVRPTRSRDAAESVNTAMYAVVNADGPMALPAITWNPIQHVFISHMQTKFRTKKINA
jgi:MoaA/NifB/PqqE/SkfB family radical SAM enzyme